jgi:putative peptidoglycan lipid II flippase
MVSRILRIFQRESSRITEAAFLIGGFSLLSQLLGLFRDRALAHFLGPSTSLDIYYAAFRIPDIIFNSVSTLVSITVLIPFFIGLIEHDPEKNTNKAAHLLNQIFTVFITGIGFIALVIYGLMPQLVHYVAPGFSPADMAQLVSVSRLMLLSPIFLGLSNLFMTVTQMYKRFLAYALSPVFYNLGIIFGIFFLLPRFGVYGLAMGVAIGAFCHMLMQLPVLRAHGFRLMFTKNIDWKEMRRILMLSLPRTLALSLSSITFSILVAIATTLTKGSVSIFNFSFNLQAVPITIIGLSYSVAVFPALSAAYAKGSITEFKKQILTVARQIIFWSLPVVVMFIVLRAQIVRVILGSGRFSWSDTRLTAAALALFMLSVLAQSLIGLLVRGYYAAGKTRRPLVVNLIFTALEVFTSLMCLYAFHHFPVFRYFIEGMLRVSDVPGTEILMLALGYSLGTLLNYYALWILFQRDFLKKGDAKELKDTVFQSFCAAFLMGAVTYVFLGVFDNIFPLTTFWGLLGQAFFSGVIGISFGIGVLKLLKSKELVTIGNALKHKIWKTETIVSEGTEMTQ